MIVALSGKKGSGKTTIATLLKAELEERTGAPWQIKSFAEPVKRIAAMLTGLKYEQVLDPIFKEFYDEYLKMTGRELLQRIGTEAMRQGVHQDVWVYALLNQYAPISNWIIDDMRFPNEANGLLESIIPSYLVRIERPGLDTSDTHSSETALDNYPYFNERWLNHYQSLEDQNLYIGVEDMASRILDSIVKKN